MVKKVLVVDDEPDLCEMVQNSLQKREDFQVIVTSRPQDVELICQQEKPDVILLDIIMPKKDGFQVLKELKSFPETERIPVIIMTMLGSDDDVKKGLKLGAADYIVKSQHAVAEMVEKIKNFFSQEQHPTTIKN